MPVKKRKAKRRPFEITDAAVARWAEIRPAGIVIAGYRTFIDDDILAEALGEHALLACPYAEDLRNELEAALCR